MTTTQVSQVEEKDIFERSAVLRLTGTEIHNSRRHRKGEAQKTASCIFTPLGTEVSRAMVAGVITSIEDRSRDTSTQFWHVDVKDRTGSVRIKASTKYGPNAAAEFFSQTTPGTFVIVAGKCDAYEPEAGKVFCQINAQMAREATLQETDEVLAEAVLNLDGRLKGVTNVRDEEKALLDKILEDVAAAIQSVNDPKPIESTAAAAVAHAPAPVVPAPTVEVVRNAKAPAPVAAPSKPQSAPEEDPALHAVLVDAIKSQPAHETKGVKWDDVEAACKAKGYTSDLFEKGINLLMDRGVVYEPTLGVLKLT